MLGNFLLLLITLSLISLLSVTATPMPGGDRGMGYALALFFCGACFLVLTGLLTWNLSANNGFDWLPVSGVQRNGLVFVGWLAFAMATAASALFKTEWHDGEFPQFLRWLSQAQAAFWLPLLILMPAAFLLNAGREPGQAPDWVKIPMMTGFILSLLMGAGLLFGWMRVNILQNAAKIEYAKNRDDEQLNNHLTSIAQHKPTDPLVNILALTGRFHDATVRDSAVAKLKLRPDWEAELIRLLTETEWDTEVYHFIDGNKVEHPELFVEPINRSIRRVAGEIKQQIADANDLQPWHFEHFSIPRLFRAIDEQFLVPGADYRPAVQELRNALDTPKPERFKKVKFTLTPLVDEWLKKHP
jgi:hypothetical protein